MGAQLDIPSRVKVPVDKLKRFILVVRSCMFDNPYHNWFHAIDVTQVQLWMLLSFSAVDPGFPFPCQPFPFNNLFCSSQTKTRFCSVLQPSLPPSPSLTNPRVLVSLISPTDGVQPGGHGGDDQAAWRCGDVRPHHFRPMPRPRAPGRGMLRSLT